MAQLGIEVQVRNIDVCRRGKLILNNVSFSVQPGTLTAIIGPNGAGKTTLMRALSGERPDSGQVLLNGEDVYKNPEYWLQQIGYVPVDNILHEQLTLYEALVYIGKLRLPHLPLSEIEAKVDALLSDFAFPSDDLRRQRPLKNLSSGERKRANVCSELIIDPPLLMLDEPTSNLDPDAERDLMIMLARYAHTKGQTILVITHTLNTIDRCDDVIFIENSKLKATGERFSVLEMLEQELADDPEPEETDEAIRLSHFYRWARVFQRFKTDESQKEDCSEHRKTGPNLPSDGPRRQPVDIPWQLQVRYLLQRYMKIRVGDRLNLLMTLGAGLSGVLLFILPAETFVEPIDRAELGIALSQARQSVYVVALIVTLIGLITSYTEISKEFRIYRHERLKGLSPSAYFLSKWIWLTGAVGILAPVILMLFIVIVYRQPLLDYPTPRFGVEVNWLERIIQYQAVGLFTRPSSWLILITLILTCIASVSLGLAISAIAGDSDKGYLYLSFVVVFIVLFSGLIRNEKLEELVTNLSFLSTGKWAYEGFASSLDIYCWLDSWFFDEFNSAGHMATVWLAFCLYTLLSVFVAIIVLRVRDPWYDASTNIWRFITRDGKKIMVFLSIAILLFSYTAFLRGQSHEFHSLNYFSRQKYGGNNAYQYANVSRVPELTTLQYWNGKINQSWCGD